MSDIRFSQMLSMSPIASVGTLPLCHSCTSGSILILPCQKLGHLQYFQIEIEIGTG